MNGIERNIGEIVMYQPDETIRLEVRVEDETVKHRGQTPCARACAIVVLSQKHPTPLTPLTPKLFCRRCKRCGRCGIKSG